MVDSKLGDEGLMPEEKSEITNAQLAAFCRQFGSLMHAEINILDIFDTLREQSDSAFMREVVDSVREDVEMGRTLATAFSRYPQSFSPFFISMVRQGELEGELDRTFDLLADHFESRMEETVDAHRRREGGAFDLETVASVFQWLFIWLAALIALCALGAGFIWYATETEAVPGETLPNVLLLVGLIMLLGVLVFSRGRKRR